MSAAVMAVCATGTAMPVKATVSATMVAGNRSAHARADLLHVISLVVRRVDSLGPL